MKRKTQIFSIPTNSLLKEKLLQWSSGFEEVIWLDSNEYFDQYSEFDAVLAVDALTVLKKKDTNDGFEALKEYQKTTNDYIFGYLSYDLKNETEALISNNIDALAFDLLYFFQPKKIIYLKGNELIFSYLGMVDEEIESDLQEIQDTMIFEEHMNDVLQVCDRISRPDYLKKVETMQEYMHRGDIYEANLCMEFYAENATINPLSIYKKLNAISTPPFATFLKLEGNYLLSASPERYIKRKETEVISQPIKGTAKRSTDEGEDKALIHTLKNDTKERAENIMIVDLVRNDLSHFATKGSVKVAELCEVYTFEQVHQLISTVVAEVPMDVNSVDLIKSTFPMGSMTGAPKISAMNIIEELEETKRGLYSGSVGYFEPNGDFDFNVVIRSILYNSTKQYASFSVGSAITSLSDPEKEYEECLLKANAMKRVLCEKVN
ncbi:para-aminobenzoate synthase [Neptunitalea chrysea]|uniref:Para-aminobenzoate synthase n=1 Tax=Neptunitalea chrysea TaxID=1647581 RepID=A0A9W6B4F2_9FLAO|nr:anthranilate synthase component I family protein [Neptunitalea chrysea]GLB52346.1 para-aminobenzoate synthase [Neptunitalea chrysea]